MFLFRQALVKALLSNFEEPLELVFPRKEEPGRQEDQFFQLRRVVQALLSFWWEGLLVFLYLLKEFASTYG